MNIFSKMVKVRDILKWSYRKHVFDFFVLKKPKIVFWEKLQNKAFFFLKSMI